MLPIMPCFTVTLRQNKALDSYRKTVHAYPFIPSNVTWHFIEWPGLLSTLYHESARPTHFNNFGRNSFSSFRRFFPVGFVAPSFLLQRPWIPTKCVMRSIVLWEELLQHRLAWTCPVWRSTQGPVGRKRSGNGAPSTGWNEKSRRWLFGKARKQVGRNYCANVAMQITLSVVAIRCTLLSL